MATTPTIDTIPAAPPAALATVDSLEPKEVYILYGPSASGKSRLAECLRYGGDLSVNFHNWYEGDSSAETLWRWSKRVGTPGWYLPRLYQESIIAEYIDYAGSGIPSIDHLIVNMIWSHHSGQSYRTVFHCTSLETFTKLQGLLPKSQSFKLTC